ncbi:beta-N-acetylhexosaminidase family protein [Actinomyces wuliandei]|uniref:beta-N-acetylhexosaminidase family protein n=1 Tax=Actinomyces wuliandei TaxID=2057743 RepID=UPI000FD7E35D|nr:beta-N-acetylglucosaminidase domain-containing protein [Actinomyces wuliandei]
MYLRSNGSHWRHRAAVTALLAAVALVLTTLIPLSPSQAGDAQGTSTTAGATAGSTTEAAAGAGSTSTATTGDDDSTDAALALHPAPRSLTWEGPEVDLTGTVELVTVGDTADSNTADGDSADTVALVRELVTGSGGTLSASGTAGSPAGSEPEPSAPEDSGSEATTPTARVVVGTDGPDASGYLEGGMSVPEHEEGYLLATTTTDGLPTVTVLGGGPNGLLYAARTLGQLTQGGVVAGVQASDQPAMDVRGVVEGFYGIPWSHEARLDTLDHMARWRMNTYVYAPKDDVYLRDQWREPYPDEELDRLSELAERARARHVELVVALSPGEDICYSSQDDLEAVEAVFDQLGEAGVDSFYLALDDTPQTLECEADREVFTDPNPSVALATAQAHLLNHLQTNYVEANGLPDLWTVPTEYTGTQATAYTTAFGQALDDAVQVQWTGEAIVTDNLTTQQATQAARNYDTTSLVVWDNFPANDGDNQARLFLGAMPARDATLATAVTGITTNPMIQPYASRLALAEYASYSWNPAAHDPQAVRDTAVADLVGEDSGLAWETMQAFIDVHEPWEFAAWEATETWEEVDAVTQALDADDGTALEDSAARLRSRLSLLRDAPTTLASMEEEGFYDDASPWIEATADWAEAGLAAVDLLVALRAGDAATAQAASTTMDQAASRAQQPRAPSLEGTSVVEDAVVPQLGETALSELVDQAAATWEAR